MDIDIREPATEDDLQLLAEMNRRLIIDEGHQNAMSVSQLEDRMRRWFENVYEARIFGISDHDIGYALWRNDPDYVFIRQFYVEPSYRRRGLGRSAMSWLVENLWPDRARIRLEVLAKNTADLVFWEALGFSEYSITLERDNA